MTFREHKQAYGLQSRRAMHSSSQIVDARPKWCGQIREVKEHYKRNDHLSRIEKNNKKQQTVTERTRVFFLMNLEVPNWMRK